jgi:hypothetical protein
MATIKMTRQWDRWAGTIPDLERATRLAAEVLNPRTGEPRCHIEIALPGRVIEADTPDALVTEIDTRDLTLIRISEFKLAAEEVLGHQFILNGNLRL